MISEIELEIDNLIHYISGYVGLLFMNSRRSGKHRNSARAVPNSNDGGGDTMRVPLFEVSPIFA
jgi:hypothetical protein